MSKNTILVNVLGQKTSALVDSGAAVTIISKQFFEKTAFNGSKLQTPNFPNVVGASGRRLEVLGKLDLEFTINGAQYSFCVHVVDGLHHSFILGVDFLCATNTTLTFSGTNTMHIPDDNGSPNVCTISTNAGLGRLSKPIMVPQRSEMNVEIKISRQKHNVEVLLEPHENLFSKGLNAAKCLVKIKGSHAVFRIMNPNFHDVYLPHNFIVAHAMEIDEKQIFPFDCQNQNKPKGPTINQISPDIENHAQIQFNLENADLDPSQKQELLKFLHEHRDNFAKDLTELGKTGLHKHHIEIQPGSRPVRLPFYRTSPQATREIDKQLQEMLENDIIQPSNSEWHSPVVLVKKKNNTYRFACDYRALNKITVPMSFPLPHIESVFDTIGEAKAAYFTNLDLMSGFWQMELDEGSRQKAAFITQSGVYEWKRMPFGLQNSPISFQTLMSNVLRGLNWKSVLVYVDDILIFSKSFDEHLKHLGQVFDRLKEANLKLQPAKCHFAVKKLKFLGHIISKNGIQVDPEKTKAMSEFPVPKTQKQVRSFLGMANYYRRFIHNFAKIATPLNAMLSKDKKIEWTESCQEAFDKLKNKLLTAPVLAYPDPDRPFILTCDASDTAIGYVLGQLDDDNKEYVIAYGGKSLTPDQKKFNTTEKECLAVLSGIEAYRPYVVHSKFTVVTDHKALVWLQTAKHTGRLERWALKLQEYCFQIIHRPGKSNCVADALSRRPYVEEEVSTHKINVLDSQPITTEPETENELDVEERYVTPAQETDNVDEEERCYIQVHLGYTNDPKEINWVGINEIDTEPQGVDHTNLSQLQQECPDFQHIYKYLKDNVLPEDLRLRDVTVAESKHFSLVDDILYHWYQRRVKKLPEVDLEEEVKFIKQIALPRELRKNALHAYHDSLAGGGHLGIEKVRTALVLKYYWPRMYQDVINYVKSCDRCQHAKKDYNPAKPPMAALPITKRFDRWHIDILGPLYKTTEGYEYILVCIDSFTRWIEAFPLRTQSAKETATILFQQIFCRYGAPRVLFSDRGRNFMSKLVNALCEMFDITQHHTSAYHPNTNGLVERQNSTIAASLRSYCGGTSQEEWPKTLHGVLMAYRKSPSMHSTEHSPYQLVFGEEMRLPFDVSLQPKDNLPREAQENIQEVLQQLKVTNEIAQSNIQKHQARNKERHDLNTKLPDFQLGDKVLIKINKVPKGLSSKLHDKADGPYEIIRLGPNFTYKLQRCSDNKIHQSMMNATNLKLYHDPEEHRGHLDEDNRPPPQQQQQQQQQLHDQSNAADQHRDDQTDNQDQPPEDQQQTADDTDTDDPLRDDGSQQPDQPVPAIPPHDPNKQWKLKGFLAGRFRNGRREIRVEWDDGTKTWEPDHCFDGKVLEEINRKFTKIGTRRKTCFKRKT